MNGDCLKKNKRGVSTGVLTRTYLPNESKDMSSAVRMANSLAIVHHGISFVSTMRSGSTTVPITFFDSKVVVNVEVVKAVVSEEGEDDRSLVGSVIGMFFEEEEGAVGDKVVSRVP